MTWSRAAGSASLRVMSRPVVLAAIACAWIQACAAAPPEIPAPTAVPSAAPESSRTEPAAPALAGSSEDRGATRTDAIAAPGQVARRDLALPFGWDTIPAAAFEEALARWSPEGAVGRLDGDALALLGLALDGEPTRALRAVLLLARSAAPEAREVLLARLERRVRPATDAFPAVDVAAAAALARPASADGPALAAALDELARGRRPHPLLVVRVECAAASLGQGRAGASAFLLAVLREGTAAMDPRPAWVRGATSIDDLAFAQWRASDALARSAGIANPYRPELSAVERARIAGEIERALVARTTSGGS